jgi:hypothetical protein
MVMNNPGQDQPLAEPDLELIERAIEIAHEHGITSADFVQMMESGVRISDFLNAMNIFTDAGHNIDCNFSWGNPPLLN